MIKKSGKAKKRRKPIREKESLGGPRITKGKSKGEYGTDPELLQAIPKKFGTIVWDLAATKSNAVVPGYFSMDLAATKSNAVVPGYFSIKDDAFKQDWAKISAENSPSVGRFGFLWLNPPFTHIDPWAAMCKREADRGAEIKIHDRKRSLRHSPTGRDCRFRRRAVQVGLPKLRRLSLGLCPHPAGRHRSLAMRRLRR